MCVIANKNIDNNLSHTQIYGAAIKNRNQSSSQNNKVNS